ncbi:hypothetical protein ACHAQA_003131 [Verticillium albo-atrum]
MRITTATKAIFIMVNHVLASHYPHDVLHAAHLYGRADFGTGLAPRQGAPLNLPNIWKCNSCVERCPAREIIDQKDCTKCKPCAQGQKPDPAKKACIKDPREDKYTEVKRDRYKEYRDNKGIDRWTKIKEREYGNKIDEKKRRKVRRMSRCLALVPLAMGAAAVEEYGEMFDEDWTESMEMLEFWPEDLEVDPWIDESSDKIYEEDAYVDQWVDIGNNQRRDLSPSLDLPVISSVREVDHDKVPAKFKRADSSTNALIVRDNEFDKRCPFCFLLAIFAAVLRTIAQVAKVARTSIKIAKGMNKRSRRDKREGANKIRQDKNWRNCLTGQNPMK